MQLRSINPSLFKTTFLLFLVVAIQSVANGQQPVWKFKNKQSVRTISFTENGRTTVQVDTNSYTNLTSRTLDANDCPTNMDFESGDFTGWNCYTGASRLVGGVNTFVPIPASPVSPINGRHTIISSTSTPMNDPYGNFPVLCPNGSSYSVKLGNTAISPTISGGGGLSDKINYTFTIPPTQNDFSLIYYYAVVFQNPTHTAAEQPRFGAKIYAQGGASILSCADYNFTATSGLPGFVSTTNSVLYKSWTPVTVNLKGYQGQTLTLEFTRENCTPSGHFGYAYIDVVPNCNGIVVNGANYCQGANSVTVSAPPGYQTYNWYDQTYSTLVGTGQTITITPAPPTSTVLNIALFPFPGFGCNDTVSTVLNARPKPTSSFTVADPTPVCLGANAFVFNNTATISDNSSLTYKWVFGDNTNSTTKNPTHTYTAAGTYSVRLITFNNAGCSDTSAATQLTVLPNPPVDFNITSATNQCVFGNSYTVTNTSSSYSSPLTYTWYFGDGSSSTTMPSESHSYAAGGSYNIKLHVSLNSNSACRDSLTKVVLLEPKPTPTFDYYTGNEQCLRGNVFRFKNTTSSSVALTYFWEFGDGSTSTQNEPQHTYAAIGAYTVKMVAIGSASCKDSITHTVTVNAHPSANFTIANAAQCFRQNNFSFTNASTFATALTYSWDFGDATTSTQQDPTKNYTAYLASYPVQLIAITDKGCKDTISKPVQLFQHPTADFSIAPNIQQCEKSNQYLFTNSSTYASALTYQWDLGNSTTSTQTNASAHYTTANNYTVKLVATTVEKGCTDTITKTVEVYKNPGATFTVTPTAQCLTGNSFTLSNAPTGATYQYKWDLGDGTGTSTSSNATYSYATAGPFTIRLIVDNVATAGLTCSDTTTQTITVNPMPVVSITNKGTHFLCQGDMLKLTAAGGVSYQWYKNGTSVTSATLTDYNATTEGYYTVDGTNQFGCKTVSLDTVFIIERKLPQPEFAWDSYCINKVVTFTNNTITAPGNSSAFAWDFGNGAPISNDTNPKMTFTPAQPYKVRLTATSTICPSQSVTKERLVNIELPPAPVRYPALNAVLNNTYTLNPRSIGTAYNWLPIIDLTNSATRNPTLKPTGERQYTVHITTPSGCQTTDSLLVRIFKKSEVLVPSGFSPNKDGLNDVLYAIPVGIKEFKFFRVYNRYGNLVFSTTNEKNGWDGFYKGYLQPTDTYTWVAEGIDDNGNLIRNGGNTILIR